MISNKTTNYNYIFVVLLDIKKVFVFLVPPVDDTNSSKHSMQSVAMEETHTYKRQMSVSDENGRHNLRN